jgi:predicted RNase H-like HicB family nuclease
MATIVQYMEAAMREASYEKLEDGTWFASIPELPGLWASGATVEEARRQLSDALSGWIEVHSKAGNRVPDLKGVSLYDGLKRVAGH